MKSKIFNTDQIRAIQDGRMTQFMQVVKPQPWSLAEEGGAGFAWSEKGRNSSSYKWNTNMVSLGNHMAEKSPLGKVGDIITVKETWCWWYNSMGYFYKADRLYPNESGENVLGRPIDYDYNREKWRSPATMPREAARLFLRITNIRVMRVQDLTNDDIRKYYLSGVPGFLDELCIWRDSAYAAKKTEIKYFKKLIGESVWADNGYHWVIDFTKTDKP